MRPIFTLVLAVSLSVLFARAEVLQPAAPAPLPGSGENGGLREEGVLSFAEFKERYHKHYASVAEEAYRLQVFSQNLKRLRKHNADPARSYSMGINSFLDISPNEFKGLYAATYHSNNYSRNLSQSILSDHHEPHAHPRRQPHPSNRSHLRSHRRE